MSLTVDPFGNDLTLSFYHTKSTNASPFKDLIDDVELAMTLTFGGQQHQLHKHEEFRITNARPWTDIWNAKAQKPLILVCAFRGLRCLARASLFLNAKAGTVHVDVVAIVDHFQGQENLKPFLRRLIAELENHFKLQLPKVVAEVKLENFGSKHFVADSTLTTAGWKKSGTQWTIEL